MPTPIVFLAVTLLAAAPAPTPAPSNCTVPDTPAAVVVAAQPNLAPLGGERHLAGFVRVRVSLDAQSHVVATRIDRSPSQILNPSALDAAQRSTYQTAMQNCVTVPSTYILSVGFDSL